MSEDFRSLSEMIAFKILFDSFVDELWDELRDLEAEISKLAPESVIDRKLKGFGSPTGFSAMNQERKRF